MVARRSFPIYTFLYGCLRRALLPKISGWRGLEALLQPTTSSTISLTDAIGSFMTNTHSTTFCLGRITGLAHHVVLRLVLGATVFCYRQIVSALVSVSEANAL